MNKNYIIIFLLIFTITLFTGADSYKKDNINIKKMQNNSPPPPKSPTTTTTLPPPPPKSPTPPPAKSPTPPPPKSPTPPPAKSPTPPPAKSTPTTLPPKREAIYSVRVTNVIDGETIEVLTDSREREIVKMVGINTTDLGKRYEREALDYIERQLSNKRIFLQLNEPARDRSNNLLAYIWLEKPNSTNSEREIRQNMFNAILIIDGYAEAVKINSSNSMTNLFYDFENQARKRDRGIWEPNSKDKRRH